MSGRKKSGGTNTRNELKRAAASEMLAAARLMWRKFRGNGGSGRWKMLYLHIHAPLAAARHSPSELDLCARLAQTLYFIEILFCLNLSQLQLTMLLVPWEFHICAYQCKAAP